MKAEEHDIENFCCKVYDSLKAGDIIGNMIVDYVYNNRRDVLRNINFLLKKANCQKGE